MNGKRSDGLDSGVYVIFGASGGIGHKVVELLSSRGAEKVVVAGRNKEVLAQLDKEFATESFIVNAEESDSFSNCISTTLKKYGKVDGVVNCIGSVLLKPAHRTLDEEWDSVIDVNLKSAFYALKSATSAMMSTGGSIVLISSAAALTGLASHEAIAAAKAGIIGLCHSAAASYARRGIRVNCIAPGMVQTSLTESLLSSEVGRKASESMHPLGRLGEPQDIAESIVWLLSKRSSWVTGQVLSVDGGLSSIIPKGR